MNIEPIGYIKTDFTSKFGIPRQSGRIKGNIGEIIFKKPYNSYDYIKGIEQFSHLWIIWGFSENENKEKHATVRPPRLGGNKRIGVFASRSPFRPNNLALSCVKLVKINRTGNDYSLIIDGADMLNGSPVFDIKPYIKYTDSVSQAKSGFAQDAEHHTLTITSGAELLDILPQEKRETLAAVLQDDPRPSYHNDPKRIYGFEYSGYEIKFRVNENELQITDITQL